METRIKRWITLWVEATLVWSVLSIIQFGSTERGVDEAIAASVWWAGILFIGFVLTPFAVEIIKSDAFQKSVAIVKVWWWTRIWWPSIRLEEQKVAARIIILRFLATRASKASSIGAAQVELSKMYDDEIWKSGHVKLTNKRINDFRRDFGKTHVYGKKLSDQITDLIGTCYRADIGLEIKNIADLLLWSQRETEDFDMSGKQEHVQQ